jgi:hypothetical protein
LDCLNDWSNPALAGVVPLSVLLRANPATELTSAVGTFETWRPLPLMSVHRERPEVIGAWSNRRE